MHSAGTTRYSSIHCESEQTNGSHDKNVREHRPPSAHICKPFTKMRWGNYYIFLSTVTRFVHSHSNQGIYYILCASFHQCTGATRVRCYITNNLTAQNVSLIANATVRLLAPGIFSGAHIRIFRVQFILFSAQTLKSVIKFLSLTCLRRYSLSLSLPPAAIHFCRMLKLCPNAALEIYTIYLLPQSTRTVCILHVSTASYLSISIYNLMRASESAREDIFIKRMLLNVYQKNKIYCHLKAGRRER